ncbi:MAG: HutD family protein [Cytophagales bacterium]|nr:HutD family protein [Cytophagales bacterium]
MSLDLSPLHIRTADCPPQPWKNGGGVTRELLTWPSKDDWQLRISVADITQDGAFSSFVGVQRAFAVIEGVGVRLQFADRLEVVTQDSAPLMFDGADAPDCQLIGGATRDLNVMGKAGHVATLTRAYAGQKNVARGFFDKRAQTLLWLHAPAQITAPSAAQASECVGWWIGFD